MKLIVLALGVVFFCSCAAAVVISAASANCGDSGGDLFATSDAPGSLGGVLGTGVTRAEIQQARKHPLGGTGLVENQYRTTAYAPAAGGTNCDSNGSCESTAAGIRVNGGSRRVYGVASNPQMNQYGALAYIWPNPYKWTGPFVVFDTGGNFDGSDGKYRIDFYIWGDADEKKSMAWGNARMVKLSKTPIVSSPGSSAQTVNASTRTSSSSVQTVNASVVTRNAPKAAAAAIPENGVKFRRPTSGPYTSPFGQRWGRMHEGLDIAPPEGTPIVAALAGRVIYAGWMSGYGNYTCIRHSSKMTTCYGHQKRFADGIRVGKVVAQSQLIGYVGNTGHSTGPHLHFEVRLGPSYTSTPVDPKPYLEGSESIVPSDAATDGAAAGACPAGASGSSIVGSSGLYYPLAERGKSLGGVAAHNARAWGNWQSDNAVDIGVKKGTPVFAVGDGRIVKLGGAWNGGTGNPDGFNVTIQTSNNQWFYTHLMARENLRVGQEVKAGQLLGKSGAANSVEHLHIACMKGDPEAMLEVPR